MSFTNFAEDIPDVDADGNPERPLPEIEDASRLLSAEIEEPPVLVDGLLHLGSKMVIGGGSKSFKTWMMLDLAISVASGVPWLHRRTNPCRVLYVNLEIQRPFIKRRIESILQQRSVSLGAGELDIWNLRGHAADVSVLRPKMREKIGDQRYG